ncbi:MAG: nucleoside phosphorylase [Acidimicrobiales bacterium]
MKRVRLDPDDRLPLLTVRAGDLPARFVVVGDPARAAAVADRLDGAEELGHNREYVVYRGRHDEVDVGVASHGVGAAGAAVCFEELCRAGVGRIIRAGTTGGLQPDVRDGDLAVATAAVRDEGFTRHVVPESYPAVASHRVVAGLLAASQSSGRRVHEGIVLTTDLFYPHPVLGADLPRWQAAGVVAVEMECAALFVVAAQHEVEAGAVLAVDGNPLLEGDDTMTQYDPYREVVRNAVDAAIDVALIALTSR